MMGPSFPGQPSGGGGVDPALENRVVELENRTSLIRRNITSYARATLRSDGHEPLAPSTPMEMLGVWMDDSENSFTYAGHHLVVTCSPSTTFAEFVDAVQAAVHSIPGMSSFRASIFAGLFEVDFAGGHTIEFGFSEVWDFLFLSGSMWESWPEVLDSAVESWSVYDPFHGPLGNAIEQIDFRQNAIAWSINQLLERIQQLENS